MTKPSITVILKMLLVTYTVVEIACLYILYFCYVQGNDVRYLKREFETEEHLPRLRELLENRSTYYAYDSTLGWAPKPNGRKKFMQVNSRGIRSSHEYEEEAPPGRVRISVFGDEAVQSYRVANQYTWAERIGQRDERFEALNYGVEGYGLDQSAWRYQRDGIASRPHIAVLGFVPGEFSRVVSTFQAFQNNVTEVPYPKPRLHFVFGKLERLDPPSAAIDAFRDGRMEFWTLLSRLGEHDDLYQETTLDGWNILPTVRLGRAMGHERIFGHDGRLNPRSATFEIGASCIRDFYETALQNHSLPIIVLFPNRLDDRNYWRNENKTFTALQSYLTACRYRFIDLTDIHSLFQEQFDFTLPRLRPLSGERATQIKAVATTPCSLMVEDVSSAYLLYYLQSHGLTRPKAVRNRVDRETQVGYPNCDRIAKAGPNHFRPEQTIEAEDGFIMNADVNAALYYGYRRANLLSGRPGVSGRFVTGGNIIFAFYIDRPDIYRLRARTICASAQGNSMFIKMGDHPHTVWHLTSLDSEWRWNLAPTEWNLQPGVHLLIVGYRETAPFDQLVLTSDRNVSLTPWRAFP